MKNPHIPWPPFSPSPPTPWKSMVKETEPEAPEALEEGALVAADEVSVTQGTPYPKRLENHCSEPISEDSVPTEVNSVPTVARLQSSSTVKPFIERGLRGLYRYGLERGTPGVKLLHSWGFSKEEVKNMGESLVKMVKVLDQNLIKISFLTKN